MPATEAQIFANRQNAQKSCGPKTSEGKVASRANAFKHGMTGAGVVLPEVDAAEVQRKADAYEAELKPSGELGRDLARRAAMLAVRMNRCVDQQTVALTERVRQVEADFEAPEGISDEEASQLRAEAVRIAMFDPGKEACLARKYEAAAERGFYRALKELRQLEQAVRAEQPTPTEAEAQSMVGSFLAMDRQSEEFAAFLAELERKIAHEVPQDAYFPPPLNEADFPFTFGMAR